MSLRSEIYDALEHWNDFIEKTGADIDTMKQKLLQKNRVAMDIYGTFQEPRRVTQGKDWN